MKPIRIILAFVLVLMLSTMVRAQEQSSSPAVDATEKLLEILQNKDKDSLRIFIETRFTQDLREMYPIEQHIKIFSFVYMDLKGRGQSGIKEHSPTDVSYFFKGPDNRFEIRLRVEKEPPHKVSSLHVGDAGPEINAQSLDDLDEEFKRLTAQDKFSGVVLIVNNAEVQFHKAYGFADRQTERPNRQETRFSLGSLNKLFTSTAILRLVEDSQLNLSNPIGQYLKEFRPEIAKNVTVRHLLEHSSGFGGYMSHPDFESNPKRFDEPADFLPIARNQELAFEPGTGMRYSNMGFVLLGVIIERVTDRDYHQVIDDVVLNPAKMTTAGPTGGNEAAGRYHDMNGHYARVDSLYPDVGTPAGGGFSSAMDLHHFIGALLNYRLLSEKNTSLLLNNFRGETRELPKDVGFSGGAPGVNAAIRVRPANRQWVIILANIEPLAISAIARNIQDLLE